MPAPRTLFLLAGLALGPTPACVLVSKPVAPTNPPATPPVPTMDAAAGLRPGEVRPVRPGVATAKAPPPADPPDSGPAQTTSRRPNPDPGPEAPPPRIDLTAARVEPGALPILTAPPSPDAPLVAAVRAYVDGRPDDAIRQLQKLDRANQDFALAVLPLLVRGAGANMAAPDPADAAVMADQFQALAAGLEGKAALRVEKVTFCKKAAGFGRYDPWPEAQPYRPNDLAMLYVEFRHVASEAEAGPNGEGYVSRAVVNLEVRDAGGRLIEQTDPADWRRRVPVARFDHADHTRSPLRDYSRTYRISVPSQPGVYTVTVEVRDPAGTRTARSQPAEFRVAGP